MQNSAVWKTVWFAAALAAAGGVFALPPFGNHRPVEPAAPEGFVPQGRPVPDRGLSAPSGGLSAKDAARQAQSLNGGGRVLSVEEAGGGYRVKLLKDGNVRFVFVPQ